VLVIGILFISPVGYEPVTVGIKAHNLYGTNLDLF